MNKSLAEAIAHANGQRPLAIEVLITLARQCQGLGGSAGSDRFSAENTQLDRFDRRQRSLGRLHPLGLK
jgi:hypothetical protein